VSSGTIFPQTDPSFSGSPFLEAFYLLNLLQRAASQVLEHLVDLEAAVGIPINISCIETKPTMF